MLPCFSYLEKVEVNFRFRRYYSELLTVVASWCLHYFCFLGQCSIHDWVIHFNIRFRRCCSSADPSTSSIWTYDEGDARSTQLAGCAGTDRIQTMCDCVYRCLHGLAPSYLSGLCIPVSKLSARSHLRLSYFWQTSGSLLKNKNNWTKGIRSFLFNCLEQSADRTFWSSQQLQSPNNQK